jgi:hypothetical protein
MPTATAERAATDAAAATSSLTLVDDSSTADSNDPSIPSTAYLRMKPRWEKCRDCFVGTEAIRAGGVKYLPQLSAESSSRYEIRRVLAAFYNGYSRTVLASVGLLLEEPPTLGEDMPEEIVELAENIDASGTHLTVFTKRLATSGTIDGYAGILVEHSRPDDPRIDDSRASFAASLARKVRGLLSSDDEKRLGLRPYFLIFRVDDVYREIYEKVNGVKTLVLLVLREVVSKRVGLFGVKSVTQYRVYRNTRGVITYELWTAPDEGTSGRPSKTEGPTQVTNQTEIPWSPLLAGEEIPGKPGEYKPPLIDLADLNIQYHVCLTNHLSLESLAYVPTPVRIGAEADDDGNYPELVLGPANTIEAPIMAGVAEPVYWLSPPVDVLAQGERTLLATKADMGTMGAAFLSAETRAAETAEGKRIDNAASRATLGTMAIALQDCLERAFGFMASYRKLKAGSVTVNDDFTGEGIDSTYLGVLITAYQQDVITLEELRYVIQTGQLPEDFDPSDKAIIDELFARAAARESQREIDLAARGGLAGDEGDDEVVVTNPDGSTRATLTRRKRPTT